MKTNSKNSRKNLLQLFGSTFLIMLFLALNTACSKPENGTNGTNGTDGKNGTNGAVGSANVIYSNWVSITNNETQIGANISQNILDKGLILMYTQQNGGAIFSLPYNDTFNNKKIESEYLINAIKVRKNFAASTIVRYIIIPDGGGFPAGRGITKPDYKNMTYSQVCALLNIPE